MTVSTSAMRRTSASTPCAVRTSPMASAISFVAPCLLSYATRTVIALPPVGVEPHSHRQVDRKSTRLNSSHVESSYAVFCSKKKKRKPPRSDEHASDQ